MKTFQKLFALASTGLMAVSCAAVGPSNPFDAVVAQDGSGDYNSVQQAINAAPDSLNTPYLIFIKNGDYEEQVVIPASKPYIHLIGQNKEQTIIHLHLNVGGKPENEEEEFWKYSVHNPDSKKLSARRLSSGGERSSFLYRKHILRQRLRSNGSKRPSGSRNEEPCRLRSL